MSQSFIDRCGAHMKMNFQWFMIARHSIMGFVDTQFITMSFILLSKPISSGIIIFYQRKWSSTPFVGFFLL